MALTDGIVGCWSPSIRGSGYLLPDLSGRGNHGVLTNMDAGTDWPGATMRGVSGRVLSYNDTTIDKRVDIGKQLPGMAGLRELTVTMWARRRAANGIANAGQAVGASYWNVVPFKDGNVYFQISPNFFSVADNVTTWRFWTMTLTGSTIRGYRDGVSVVSGTGPATVPTVAANFVIGSYPPYGDAKGNSEIGEVAVYQRALTQPEVLELFRRGNGAIGRELTGQTRRRVFGFVQTGARRRRILTGMV